MTIKNSDFTIYADIQSLNTAVAKQWIKLSKKAIDSHGKFRIALAGGSTPKKLYERLTEEPIRKQIDWSNNHFFFGDERTVDPSHADSNFNMAKKSLFDPLEISESQVFRMHGETKNHSSSAKAYENHLAKELPRENDLPCFDLVLLGLGPDGHIASLFPDTPILREEKDWVKAVYVEKMDTWRISLTYPILNNAKQIFLMVGGKNKAQIVNDVLSNQSKTTHYPVENLNPRGVLSWFIDEEAAQKLCTHP